MYIRAVTSMDGIPVCIYGLLPVQRTSITSGLQVDALEGDDGGLVVRLSWRQRTHINTI